MNLRHVMNALVLQGCMELIVLWFIVLECLHFSLHDCSWLSFLNVRYWWTIILKTELTICLLTSSIFFYYFFKWILNSPWSSISQIHESHCLIRTLKLMASFIWCQQWKTLNFIIILHQRTSLFSMINWQWHGLFTSAVNSWLGSFSSTSHLNRLRHTVVAVWALLIFLLSGGFPFWSQKLKFLFIFLRN